MKKLLEQLRKLNLPQDQYAVYGSGPLAIRKIREAKDLDIIVTDDLYQKLKEKYPRTNRYKGIIIGEIEIYPVWAWEPEIHGLEGCIKRAEMIDGIKYINLEDLIQCKRMMGGEKHLNDIRLIKNYLRQYERNTTQK